MTFPARLSYLWKQLCLLYTTEVMQKLFELKAIVQNTYTSIIYIQPGNKAIGSTECMVTPYM